MPREVSEVTRWAFLAVALVAVPASPPVLAQQQATLTTAVAAGTHKALRLRGLLKDAQVAVAIQASGRVMVTFVTEADYKRYPNPQEPVFAAPVERQLSFALVMPETTNYYVVFDNTKGMEERKVQMVIRAARGTAQVPAPASPAAPGSVVPPGPPPPTQPKAQQHDM